MTTRPRGCLGIFLRLTGDRPTSRESQTTSPDAFPYTLTPTFLTPAERSFFGVLQLACEGRFAIFSKVRLADLFNVTVKGAGWTKAFNQVSQKHVDFLLCDALELRPILLIELDDKSHRSAKTQSRDLFLQHVCDAARVPLMRVPASVAYSPRSLRAAIEQRIGPTPEIL